MSVPPLEPPALKCHLCRLRAGHGRDRQVELALVGRRNGVAKCLNSSREAECLEFDRKFDF